MAAAPTGTVVACPVYPWPTDAAQRGAKVFMQSDCAACHSALPYAGLRESTSVAGVAMTAEILVAAAPEPAAAAAAVERPLHGGACTPDLTVLATKIQGGLRRNLYSAGGTAMLASGTASACQELKKGPVWLHFAQAFQAA